MKVFLRIIYYVMMKIMKTSCIIVCSRASRYFSIMMSTDAYTMIERPSYFSLCYNGHYSLRVSSNCLSTSASPTSRPREYANPYGGPTLACVGCVYRSTTHPTYSGLESCLREWNDVLNDRSPMLYVFAFTTPIVRPLNEYFLKYSSHMLLLHFR